MAASLLLFIFPIGAAFVLSLLSMLRQYLSREPMEVRIDSSSSVDELIRSVLSSHQRDGDSGLKLHYHAPECYELRLHEG